MVPSVSTVLGRDKHMRRLIRKAKVGDYDAVVPTLSGRAWITGFADYVIDAEDPFPEGFTVGDIWGRV